MVEFLLARSGRHLRLLNNTDHHTLRALVDALEGRRVIGLPSDLRVDLAPGVTETRTSYDGPAAVFREVSREDPTTQALFALCSRRRTPLDVLQP